MKKIISIALIPAIILIAAMDEQEKNSNRPNIILIMADDMGYSDLGYFGSEIQTPNLDKMAANGLVMTQFYNSGRCVPTRASLLTGLYQHQVGTGHMTGDRGYPSYQGYLNKKGLTLAEVLRSGGYSTMMTGKWHLGEPEESWPQNRGFEYFYGVPKGGGIYYYPFLIDRDVMLNDQVIQVDSASFYSTDAFNDYAVQFLDKSKDDDTPFFLYVAHIAPHFPLQAPEEDVTKYTGTYRKNPEFYRRQRLERQKKMGLQPEHINLSPPDRHVNEWDTLSEAEKDTLSKEMAVYAAQIDRMDQGIGRIMNKLKEIGKYENTILMFLSDNGGIGVDSIREIRGADGPIGSRFSWRAYSPSWGNVSNTPYRYYKSWVHEGGVSTPLIIHWPEGIKQHRKENQVGHVIDIMPTLLELTDVEYPETYNGKKILPLEGVSLVPVIKGNQLNEERELFWEHEGNRAVRKGKWKLVSEFPDNVWHLYDMKKDRTELKDLSKDNSELVQDLIYKYEKWAGRVGVVPWNEIVNDH